MRPCPCCDYATIDDEPGSYDICCVCFWEDDPVQATHPDQGGGANIVSLHEARANFAAFRASERRFVDDVRAPTTEEIHERSTRS